MKIVPAMAVGAVLLLIVTVAALGWLPTEPAWALLGQIATSAARLVSGGAS